MNKLIINFIYEQFEMTWIQKLFWKQFSHTPMVVYVIGVLYVILTLMLDNI